MKKDPIIFLTHIMESIALLERYLHGVTEKKFYASDEKKDLAARRIEIIGEAMKNLPKEFKKAHPEIAWRDAQDMRNVLIHEYFEIDYGIVWQTVTKFIPKLKRQLQALLPRSSEKI